MIEPESNAWRCQPRHAFRDAELRLARAELDDATLAALVGLYYDADEYDRLVIAYRRARRAAQAGRPSVA